MFRDEPCLSGMIGVHVRAEDLIDWLAAKATVENGLPQFGGFFPSNAGVDHCPAGLPFEQVEVDMVQGHRQWHAQPKNTFRYLNGLSRCRDVGNWILKHGDSSF